MIIKCGFTQKNVTDVRILYFKGLDICIKISFNLFGEIYHKKTQMLSLWSVKSREKKQVGFILWGP